LDCLVVLLLVVVEDDSALKGHLGRSSGAKIAP
jgi:hypothetical protein